MMKNIRQTITARSFEAPHSYMGENKSANSDGVISYRKNRNRLG